MEHSPNVVLGGEGLPALPGSADEGATMPVVSQPTQQTDGIPNFYLKKRELPNGEVTYVEMVDITIPGDPKCSPTHKVSDGIRRKYAWHYDLFKRGLTASPQGTPIDMGSFLDPAQIRVLKGNNIFTVEQLANLPDANDHRIPMAKTMKNRARAWLEEQRERNAQAERSAETDALKGSIAVLEKALADQAEMMRRMASGEQIDPKVLAGLGAQPVPETDAPHQAEPEAVEAGESTTAGGAQTETVNEAAAALEQQLETHPDAGKFGDTVPATVEPSAEGLALPYNQHGWNTLRAEYQRRFGKGTTPGTSKDDVIAALVESDTKEN